MYLYQHILWRGRRVGKERGVEGGGGERKGWSAEEGEQLSALIIWRGRMIREERGEERGERGGEG